LAAGCGRVGFDTTHGAGDARSSGDSGLSGDGGGGDGSVGSADGATVGPCGPTVALSDDFQDGVTAPEWTVLNGSGLTVAETGGFLQITFGGNVPSNQTAGYSQTATMDYTGSCTIVELDEIPNAAANGRLQMRLSMGSSNYLMFEVLAGQLYGIENDGTVMNRYAATWSVSSQRFLRMRERSGTWFWDVSPDGVMYTEVGAITVTIPGQTAASLALYVSTSAGVSNGGQVQIGSVQVLLP
jgi:hypothetical protein